MADQAVLQEIQLTLKLAPDMELVACEKACAVAQLAEMSPDRVDEVRMAVVEAVINAIEHSGADDDRLHLNIAILGQPDQPQTLCITVQDHGVGFDPRKLVQPRIEDKITADSKRGAATAWP
jgi:anti-sigma regulatory factor (Ser/Thr protein kinase)